MTAARSDGSSGRAVPTAGETSDGWQVHVRSVRGASHSRSGAPNQDSGKTVLLDHGAGAILAVADGHGSSMHPRSDRGSRFAVDVAIAVLAEWMRRSGSDEAALRSSAAMLADRILTDWRDAVADDIRLHPLSAADIEVSPGARQSADILYGSTLLAAAINDRFAAYIQIGDGDIVAISSDGTVQRVLPNREDLPLNVTESLCQSDARSRFRSQVDFFPQARQPALLLLSTDGYSNSFADEPAFLKVGADIRSLIATNGLSWVTAQLGNWLADTSAAGSGDDITVALAWRRSGSAASAPATKASVPTKPPWRAQPLVVLTTFVASVLLLGGICWIAAPPRWKEAVIARVDTIRDETLDLARTYAGKARHAVGLPSSPIRRENADDAAQNAPAPASSPKTDGDE